MIGARLLDLPDAVVQEDLDRATSAVPAGMP